MGHVNVKQLGMDMRDWYRLAFKSSLHGYVGMLSKKFAQTIQNSNRRHVNTPEPDIRQLSPATTMAASATPIANIPANTPEPAGPELQTHWKVGQNVVKIIGNAIRDPLHGQDMIVKTISSDGT